MALKKKINKKAHDKLSESFQDLYTETEDGDFVLDVEGEEDLGALKRAKEHESTRRKEEARRRRELEAKLKDYEEQEEAKLEADSKKAGDFESLEASLKAKHEKEMTTKDETIAKLTGQVTTLVVDSVADSIASDISVSPKLLAPLLRKRLSADLENDTPSTRVLDAEGNLSAMSLDELKTEFKENPEFSAVMIASKASGGGKTTDENLASNPGGVEKSSKALVDMTDRELADHISQTGKES